jgi:diguanylate cyclase (GGDEF)-like protein
MTPGGFTDGAAAVLDQLASLVPLSMWLVSRKSGDDYVILAAHDRQYGLVQGDVLPWSATLCARVLDGGAPGAVGDIARVPALRDAAAELRMDIGAYITVPLRTAGGTLLGTLCGGDPLRREGPLDSELAHVERCAQVLSTLLEQQLLLEQATRRSDAWELAASADPLTGLGSRGLWEEALPRVDAQCAALGSRAAVLVLDLDGLKDVNDLLGHAAGDALLRATGDVLRRQLRDADVLARTGGDEFAAVLVEVDDGAAQAAAERLRAALASVDIEVSIGVCVRTAEMSVGQAWQLADSAMYVDKLARSAALGTGRAARAGGHRAAWVPNEAALARQESVAALLREVRQALGLPVAFVSRFADGRRIIETVDSTCPVPFRAGDSHPSQETYCQAIVDGRLPQAVPDTAAHPLTAGLAVTQELGIGSYIGVPILMSDASVYGTLCAYAEDARPVDERDTALLHLVARTIGLQLSVGLEGRQRTTQTLDRIDHVLAGDLLTSAYQPVVDLSSGCAVAVEGLARFPESYGRRPDQWFADAVEVGRATELELAAATKATQGLDHLPVGVALSVNVSAAVAVAPEFLRWLMSAPLDRLILELTEHEQVEDYEALNAALLPARQQGMRLAVDDAGAGYASMRHWLLLKPDLLKLDISLVRDVDSDAAKRALCRAIITFAHATGMRVIAEGVETQAELAAVRALGADYGQGYLLQRPAGLDQLVLKTPVADGRLEPVGAELLRTMRELAHAGCSPATIAARLNGLGERRPDGVRWHRTSVVGALQAAPSGAPVLTRQD